MIFQEEEEEVEDRRIGCKVLNLSSMLEFFFVIVVVVVVFIFIIICVYEQI